ncbi:MAG: amino acid ABC transporter permease [Pseudomonas helleri]|uniref:Glutamate/aspartate import permease protein GltK n=1 Tax=Pseudomonas helleri TaxID=1608996 RepID=A0A7X1YAY7_9PSED|nr:MULTISPECIES: ABC transporter permease subunit [Pseudomonas]MQT76036.1 ABC transporter permease subunit [Pseudomonas helleri]MQT97946.1 ABC transporter permease subunit [Pseudomonas helleri]MQU33835.1 ABC transporter permease subunit [Pseudomonas helleri]
MNLDYSVVVSTLPYLGKGLLFSLQVTLVAMTGGIVFGTLLALARLSRFKTLALVASAYVNLMRSIPLILAIFWIFFLVPEIAAWLIGASQPVQIGTTRTAFIAFTLFEAAYFCEVIRAGIMSVSRGQSGAGYALGFSYSQNMRYVVLPQAFRAMIPILLTQTIILFQDTSLLYVISATDFLGAASKVAQRDNRLVEFYTFAALVYFVICFALSKIVKQYQTHLTRNVAQA